jgi:hypothetical protein
MNWHFGIVPSPEDLLWFAAGVLVGGLLMAILFRQYEARLVARYQKRIKDLHDEIDLQSKTSKPGQL